jgi:hypothetical protein
MVENNQFITYIAGKYAFSKSGEVFYWDSYEPNSKMGLMKSIYPFLNENQTFKNRKIFSKNNFQKYIPYLIGIEEIGFFNTENPLESIKPFTFQKEKDVVIEKIVAGSESIAILLSNQKLIFAKKIENTNPSRFTSFESFYPKFEITIKVLDVAIHDLIFSSFFAILCEDNQLFIFNTESKELLKLNLANYNTFIGVSYMNGKVILTDIHYQHFILENNNGKTETFELFYFLDYQKFNDELSPLNHPELNRHFLLTTKQELKIIHYNSDFPIMNTIIFPLKENENIIDIQLASYNSYGKAALVLTNNGRIFGIKDGFKDQKESNEPIQFNHFIGLKTSFEDITQIMQVHQKNINIGKPIDSWNHPELFHNDFFLLYETITNNFVRSNYDSFYTKEKIIKFINQLPEKSIDLLHLNLKTFKEPKEIEPMSKLIPEFILLFHNGYDVYSSDIPLETFLKHLKPIIYKSDGSLKTIKELFPAKERAFGLFYLTDNLNELSNNFLLALLSLGFKFDFISYPYLLNNGYRGMRSNVPKEVLLKVQEECTLEGEIKLTQNQQIEALLENDYVVLANRLIQSNTISKSKFTSFYTKSPEKFSIPFRSMILSAQPEPAKNKQLDNLKLDNQSMIEGYSDSNQAVVRIKGNYYYLGWLSHSNFAGVKNNAKTPFLLTTYIQSIHPNSKLAFLTALRDTFTYVYQDGKVFVEGDLARQIRKIQGGDESKNVLEVTQLITLNQGESIQKMIINGTNQSPIILTSTNRLLLFMKDENFRLFTNKQTNKEISLVDVTPYDLLSQGEHVTHIITPSTEYIFIVTSKGNIYFKTKDHKDFMLMKLPNSKETILTLKAHKLGVVLKTNQNQLWYSGLRLEGVNVIPWNQSIYYSKNEKTPDYPIFDFDMMQLPLEKEETIINFDVGQKHALAISNLGKVFLWGDNDNGALGTVRAKITNQLDLTFLKKGELVVEGFTGDECTYLITSLQRVFAFGKNQSYSLGDGTSTNRYQPVDLTKKFIG